MYYTKQASCKNAGGLFGKLTLTIRLGINLSLTNGSLPYCVVTTTGVVGGCVLLFKRFSKKITTSRAGGIEKSFSYKLMERSE